MVYYYDIHVVLIRINTGFRINAGLESTPGKISNFKK